MPVYNAGRYLDEAVGSILDQTFTNLNLVIVDDGSTDGSLARARAFEEKDGRVRVVRQENAGTGAARNCCLAESRGELLANLDADDVAEPMRIEKQVAFMKEHPDCVAVGTQSLFVDSDGDPLGTSSQPLTHDEIEAQLWHGLGTAMTQSTVMMRRETVTVAGGYDEALRVSEDLDLYLRLLDHGRFANLPDRLNMVRRHCGSVSAVGNRIEEQNPREEIVRCALQRRGLSDRDLNIEFPPHPTTRAEWHAKWAFRAQRNGYPGTARKHARRAMMYGPLNPWALRALVHMLLLGREERESNRRKRR